MESKDFERGIVAIIVANAITLGLETTPGISSQTLTWLQWLDGIFLAIFTVEIGLKLLVYKSHFARDPWRIFDLSVVLISHLPTTGAFSVVRSLRVLRTLRMISVIPSLRRVVNGLLSALPGLGSVGAIMLLIFYVGSIMATKLFGEGFPEWFGNLGASAYTLFQIMTLESWSMGIVRPVMERYPFAWLFFIPFILVATFTMLNLFIAVIVNAMQSETEQAAENRAEQGHDERLQLIQEMQDLKEMVAALDRKLKD
ncbi:ion transporter [Pseudobacteriovorax antillogorgiicola]|uniref:ion transporter n=1 Tax=Pseudobacteriovorax antillogorgiicola TaxID=1513793 RepID=UPI00190EAC99|nr:ion transporter [Pseudobacteriovorax antillogorgiicola]